MGASSSSNVSPDYFLRGWFHGWQPVPSVRLIGQLPTTPAESLTLFGATWGLRGAREEEQTFSLLSRQDLRKGLLCCALLAAINFQTIHHDVPLIYLLFFL